MYLPIVEKNINAVIERLKELETPECKKYYSKEQLQFHLKFATQMFRSLLQRREQLRTELVSNNNLVSANPITVTISD
jgi:hypothetical protein